MMGMKCEICGQKAPFFIESYLTHLNKPVTFHFCERHMMQVNLMIKLTIDELQARNRMVEGVKE